MSRMTSRLGKIARWLYLLYMAGSYMVQGTQSGKWVNQVSLHHHIMYFFSWLKVNMVAGAKAHACLYHGTLSTNDHIHISELSTITLHSQKSFIIHWQTLTWFTHLVGFWPRLQSAAHARPRCASIFSNARLACASTFALHAWCPWRGQWKILLKILAWQTQFSAIPLKSG